MRLTACRTVLCEKLKRPQLLKKLPSFHKTRRFSTEFTSARHLSLSRPTSIQSIPPHPTTWLSIFNIILPSTPRSSKWSLSLTSPPLPKTLCGSHQSPIRATCLAHRILDLIIIIIIIISNLSNDRSKASSKTIPPHSAI